jgi:large subunit ribosomal protein L35
MQPADQLTRDEDMPKLKTRRGAAKRFKPSASGKVRHRRAYRSHILTKKSTKRKRRMRRSGEVTAGSAALLRKLLPYD